MKGNENLILNLKRGSGVSETFLPEDRRRGSGREGKTSPATDIPGSYTGVSHGEPRFPQKRDYSLLSNTRSLGETYFLTPVLVD